jgi:Cu/Ag efflux pump CusA
VVRYRDDGACATSRRSRHDARRHAVGGARAARALATSASDAGPTDHQRENVQRKIVVMANVAGRDLGGVVDDIRAASREVRAAAGYHVEYGGQFESAEEATRTLVLGLAVIVGHLPAALPRVPLAARRAADHGEPAARADRRRGGVFLAGGVLSVASLVGFITLFGIATRNGIMLVSHIRHLRDRTRA